MLKKIIIGVSYMTVSVLMQAEAQTKNAAGFEQWKSDFIKQASSAGIDSSLLADFQQSVQFYPPAVRSDKTQSEFQRFMWDYLKSAVTAGRVKQGKKKYADNNVLLKKISKQTGVSSQTLVAIWGMESRFGGYTGTIPVMNSMATLAYEGRRQQVFENELMAALALIQRGDISSFSVKGSWAGGLGMTQFIPSTYERYAVDFDGDGKRNLWQTADALASAGNYLSQMGWVSGQRWGREVSVSSNFDYLLANDVNLLKPLSEWRQLGVKDAFGRQLPVDNVKARLFIPAGLFGPKFLLYKNFDVIKKYNMSDAYALSVSLLSDKIIGREGVVAKWPSNAMRLRRNDVKAVQQILNDNGYSSGTVDGMFGNSTRRGIQSFQAANGQIPDGFLTAELFRKISNL